MASRSRLRITSIILSIALILGMWSGDFHSFALTNPWSAVANLPIVVYDHAQSTLSDGTVLVTGGWSSGAKNTCYKYTPSTNTWTTAANLPAAFYGHAQSTLSNGKVLVTGGYAPSAARKNCYLYTPSTNSWEAAANLPTALCDHTQVTLADGRVLVVGGNYTYIYNPSTNAWSTAPVPPDDATDSTLTLLQNGKALWIGYDRNYTYDPATSVWAQVASLPAGIYQSVARTLANGKVMLCAGMAVGDPDDVVTNKTYIYDPARNTWTPSASMPLALWYHAGSVLNDGRLLITGGDDYVNVVKTCYIFNDTTFDTVNSPAATASNSSSVQVTASASDVSGLDYAPYLFNRNGADIGTWVNTATITDTGLLPNTLYTYKFKARDNIGNVSAYSATISKYTYALNPTSIVLSGSTNSTASVTITGNASNGQLPQYYLELKVKGAGAAGANVAVSNWSTSTSATLTGLNANTEYELWLTTRNSDAVANAKYLALASLKTDAHPSITNTTANNQVISAVTGFTNVTVSGTVSDINSGDILKTYYRVDGTSGTAGTNFGSSITANGSSQAFSGSLNLSTASEGTHSLYLWVEDNRGGKSAETVTSFKVDKSVNTVNAPTVTAVDSSSVNILPVASDTSGLDTLPYLYNRDGVDITTWTNTSPYIDSGLTANSQHSYKYKVKDKVGNISAYATPIGVYTYALDPQSVSVSARGATSVNLQIQGNPANAQPPQYYAELKLKGAGASGANVSVSNWSANTDITFTGLRSSLEYEVWLTTKNADGKTNLKYLAVQIPKSGTELRITESAIDHTVISDLAGYRIANITGSISGAASGDILKVIFRVDGTIGSNGIQIGPDITATGSIQTFSESLDLSAYSEGSHTLNVWIESNSGDKSSETAIPFINDRTAPNLGSLSPSVKSSSEIRLWPTVTDINGLDLNPYLFNRDGADIGTWINSLPFDDSGLLPNTQYVYKYMAKDSVGNVSGYSIPASIYTAALDPLSVSIAGKTPTTVDISIEHNAQNATTPEYKLELKVKGAGPSGSNTAFSDWSTNTAIHFSQLSTSEDYELWVTTRNMDNFENPKYKALEILKINTAPTISNQTVDNKVLSAIAGFTSIDATGTVSDADVGDILKVYFRIDGNQGAEGVQISTDLTADGTEQSFSQSIDISSLAEGDHTLYIWVEDNRLGKSAETVKRFKVDKSITTFNSPTLNVISSNEITIISSASDSNGLDANPYLYNKDGLDMGTWTSSASITDANLVSNHQYTYKYKVKDSVGNESDYSAPLSKYTLALDPTEVTYIRKTNSSIEVSISGNTSNGQLPEYKLELKLKGAGAAGTNVAASDWSTGTARTLTGLNYLTEYELWLTTRNGDGIANTAYLAIAGIGSSSIVPVINNTSAEGQIISAVSGYDAVNVSGTAIGANSGDILKTFYRLDGTIGEQGIEFGQQITASGQPQPFSGGLKLSNASEGEHKLYLWVEDDGGAKSTEAMVNFKIDKTVDTAPQITRDSNSAVVITPGTDTISGVSKTFYRLEGALTQDWTEYTSPFAISGSGYTKVYAKTVDNVGNESKITLTTFFNTIQVIQGQELNLALKASNIENFNACTFNVSYNSQALTVTDLCAATNEKELALGPVKGTNIEIISFSPGHIVFKINKTLPPGEKWTGVADIIKFLGNSTGGTSISFTID